MVLIAVINAVLALVASAASFWASSRVGKPLNIVLIIAGALAFFYGGAYFWLAFNITEVVAWSNFLRPLGILSWPIAWIAPPLAIVKAKNIVYRALIEGSRPENVITDIKGVDPQVPLNRSDYSE